MDSLAEAVTTEHINDNEATPLLRNGGAPLSSSEDVAKRAKYNEYKRNYNKTHRAQINEIQRNYVTQHKQEIKTYLARKADCPVCNKKVVWTYLADHNQTKAHIKKLSAQLMQTQSPSLRPGGALALPLYCSSVELRDRGAVDELASM